MKLPARLMGGMISRGEKILVISDLEIGMQKLDFGAYQIYFIDEMNLILINCEAIDVVRNHQITCFLL